ncbi:MAG: hypothetical protein ACLQVI_00920 [Polyangiaceae bacterium]
MTSKRRSDYLTRDAVMKLLSDEEIASVSTAETAPRVAAGDEYLDLEQLDRGVLRGPTATPMGRVLPRKAVRKATWSAILTRLPEPAAGVAGR